jgi:hypothetical protein
MQVIPNIQSASLGSTNRASRNVYAFVSVEDANRKVTDVKHLCGLIQIFDLTNSTRAGGVLAEVCFNAMRSKRSLLSFVTFTLKANLPVCTFVFARVSKIKIK